jgi:uncharacterized protein YndB with AHSA1/START domain
MPEFTVTSRIDAPVERVWEVLDDFGDISRWNSGVKRSALTSDGPVGEGATRHCDFTPLGGVDERIETYVPNERMTISLFDTSKLPISSAVADFNLAPDGDGTTLTLHYSYTPNRIGRVAKGTTDKQLRKGIGGLADELKLESERLVTG